MPRRKCFAPRSANGCVVCRQRRLKCDEKLPECDRCVQGSWTCQYRGRAPYASFHNGSTRPAAPASSLHWDADSKLSGSEREALHRYTSLVAADLFEFLVSDFWTYTVAQRCYAVPIVRSAVLALSSTHLDFATGPHSPGPGISEAAIRIGSLQLYHVAVASLRLYITQNDKPSRADVLLTCAALICCDLMRGDCKQATVHVDHGSAVVRAWQQEVADRPAGLQRDNEFEEIAEVFRLFDLHATTFDDSRLPLLPRWHNKGDAASAIPTRFLNLQQAQRCLVPIQSAAFVDLIQSVPHKFQHLSHVPRYLVLRRSSTRASFEAWSCAFARLESNGMQSTKTHSSREQAAISVLKMHHRVLQLLLDQSFQESDLCKPFDQAGEQLLQWAEEVLHLRSSESCSRFSIDVGPGPSLFLLILKTTQSSTRRRATELLARVRKLEGWHNPQAMLQAVEKLTDWQASGEPESPEDCTGLALEYVAERVAKHDSSAKRSTWLEVSYVQEGDPVPAGAL